MRSSRQSRLPICLAKGLNSAHPADWASNTRAPAALHSLKQSIQHRAGRHSWLTVLHSTGPRRHAGRGVRARALRGGNEMNWRGSSVKRVEQDQSSPNATDNPNQPGPGVPAGQQKLP